MRKWLLIAAAVVVAVALVGGTLLLNPKKPIATAKKDSSSGPSYGPGALPVAGSGSAPLVNSGGSAGKQAKPGKQSESGQGSSTGAASGQAQGGAGSRPDPGRSTPAVIAKPGVALKPVQQPPAKTIAMLDSKAAPAGSAYNVTFEPFGMGPMPQSLVLHVLASTPVGNVGKPLALKDANVLVTADPAALKAVRSGGKYEGTLTLTKKNELLVFVLSNVRSSKK